MTMITTRATGAEAAGLIAAKEVGIAVRAAAKVARRTAERLLLLDIVESRKLNLGPA
jgi:hypothetical protein